MPLNNYISCCKNCYLIFSVLKVKTCVYNSISDNIQSIYANFSSHLCMYLTKTFVSWSIGTTHHYKLLFVTFEYKLCIFYKLLRVICKMLSFMYLCKNNNKLSVFISFTIFQKKSSISGCRTLCNAMTMNMLHPNRHQMKMLKNK